MRFDKFFDCGLTDFITVVGQGENTVIFMFRIENFLTKKECDK